MLRWHYRSRNEKLINFSNHHFYEINLSYLLLQSIKNPIHQILLNQYKRRINSQEKEELIDGLVEFMKHNIRKNDNDKKAKSCLVVAINQSQADLIDEVVED